jgi:filamentous hemagglutinin family protein
MKYDMRLSVLFATVLLGLSGTWVNAQVVPDQTLGGENSVVNSQTVRGLPAQLIQGGSQRNTNLFHSFSQFNINAGQAAYFSNPTGISNILTRVTGTGSSQINGTLGVLGSANLFLLNPHGVIFGETAVLDLQGSLFTTSAERFQFADGSEFGASNPRSPSVLAVNVPVGLGFGSDPGPLINNGANVSLPPQQSFTFAGGNIRLRGGMIAVPNGQIALISSAGNQQVSLRRMTGDWTFQGLENFGDIELSQGAIADSSGDGGGRIDLQGRNVALQSGSTLFAVTLGRTNGRGVEIQAADSLDLSGADIAGSPSTILVRTLGPGRGGNLNIQAPQLLLRDGAFIGVDSLPVPVGEGEAEDLNVGDAGNALIQAQTIEFSGRDRSGTGSLLGAATFTLGKGGNIEIIADQFSLREGASINASTFSSGEGGDIKITAGNLSLDDASVITVATLGSGNSGNLTLMLRTLAVRDGSQVGPGTFAAGDSGDLLVSASESIDIAGVGSFLDEQGNLRLASSGLFASVEPDLMGNGSTAGNGGRLTIETGRLTVADGGKIATNTSGTGNAGDIFIRAETVDVSSAFIDFSDSRNGITSSVERIGSGQGGNVTVEAQRIRVFDGGQISASSLGQGDAGNVAIQSQQVQVQGASADGFTSQIAALSANEFTAGSVDITAQTVELRDGAELTVSSQGNAGNLIIRNADLLLVSDGSSLRAETQAGNRGNIEVVAKQVQLQRQGQITTNASDQANGGNISFTSETLVLLENSEITANAVQGQGGNIGIETQGLFRSPESRITAASELGIDGTIDISVLDTDHQNALIEQSTTLADPSELVANSCLSKRNGDQGRFVISGNGGTPFSPFDPLPLTYRVLPDSAAASKASASRVQGETPETSIQEANQLRVQPNGDVQLVVAGSELYSAAQVICATPELTEES